MDTQPVAVSVNYDLSHSSRSLNSYRVSIAFTDEQPTGKLGGENTVFNSNEHRSGVFGSLAEGLEALRDYVTAPFSVHRNLPGDELVVLPVDAGPRPGSVRVATVSGRGVVLHDQTEASARD